MLQKSISDRTIILFVVAKAGKKFQVRSVKEMLSMEDKEKTVLDEMKKLAKPVRPGDVAKSLDMESKEVSKIIDSLKKKGLVDSPKRCYYAPSKS